MQQAERNVRKGVGFVNMERLRDQVYLGIERQCADLPADPYRVQNVLRAANKEEKAIAKNKLSIGLVLMLAAMLLSVTAAAAGLVMGRMVKMSSSFVIPEYTRIPTAQECIERIGYAPVLMERFENGYAFKGASVKNNTLKDELRNYVETYRSLTFYYTRGKDVIILSAQKHMSETEHADKAIKTAGDVQLYYTSFLHKAVPEDYEITDEEKEAKEKGELVFSYGTAAGEVSNVQVLHFEKDGIEYILTQMEGAATADEMVSMAEEIIGFGA